MLGGEAVEHLAQRLVGCEWSRQLAHRFGDRDLCHQGSLWLSMSMPRRRSLSV